MVKIVLSDQHYGLKKWSKLSQALEFERAATYQCDQIQALRLHSRAAIR